MDKAEYRIKLEQINNLAENGDFKGAAAIADTIEWKKVRSVRTLCMIGEIYEANRRYSDSEQILKYAYRQSSSSKTVLYRLTEIEIRMGFYDEAKRYYQEFEELSPHDTSRYILKYKLLRAQGAPLTEQIEVLREYKEREYTERWAFELARLYKKNGQKQRCIEECDDMILWFAEGKYVTRAMELKMQLEPLSEAQQKRYDNRHKAAIEAERRAIPDDDLNGFDRVQLAINRADEEDYELRPERQKKVTAAEAIQKMNAAADEAVTTAIFEEKTPNVRPGIRTGRAVGRSSDIQDQIASSFREAVSSIRKPRQLDYTDLYSEEEEPGEDFEESFEESAEDRGNAELEALFAETGSMFAKELADTFGVRSGSTDVVGETPETETSEEPEAAEEEMTAEAGSADETEDGAAEAAEEAADTADEEVSVEAEDAADVAEAEETAEAEDAADVAETAEAEDDTEASEEPEEAIEEVSGESAEDASGEETEEQVEAVGEAEAEESEIAEAESGEVPEAESSETTEAGSPESLEYDITDPEIEGSVADPEDTLEPVDPSEAIDMIEEIDRSLVEGVDEDFDLSALTDDESAAEAAEEAEETAEALEEAAEAVEEAEVEKDEIQETVEEAADEETEVETTEVEEAVEEAADEEAEAEPAKVEEAVEEVEEAADEEAEAEPAEVEEAVEAAEEPEAETDEIQEAVEEVEEAADEEAEAETTEVEDSVEEIEEAADEESEAEPVEVEKAVEEIEEAADEEPEVEPVEVEEAVEEAEVETTEVEEAVEVIKEAASETAPENTEALEEAAEVDAAFEETEKAEEIEQIAAGDSDETDIPCEKHSFIEEEISESGSIDSQEDEADDEEAYEPYDLEAEAEALRAFGETFSEIEHEAAEISKNAAELQPVNLSVENLDDIAPVIYDSETAAEEAAVREELKAEAEESGEAVAEEAEAEEPEEVTAEEAEAEEPEEAVAEEVEAEEPEEVTAEEAEAEKSEEAVAEAEESEEAVAAEAEAEESEEAVAAEAEAEEPKEAVAEEAEAEEPEEVTAEAETEEPEKTAAEENVIEELEEIPEEKPYVRKIRPVTEESVAQEIAEGTEDVLEETVPEAVWASLSRRMASAVERMSARIAPTMSWDNVTDSYDEADLKSTIEPEEESELAVSDPEVETEMTEEAETVEETVEEAPEETVETEETETVEEIAEEIPEETVEAEETVEVEATEEIVETAPEAVVETEEVAEAVEEIAETAPEAAVETEEVAEAVEEIVEEAPEEAVETVEETVEAETAEDPGEDEDLTKEAAADIAVAVEETIGEAEAAVEAVEAEAAKAAEETAEAVEEAAVEAETAEEIEETAETVEEAVEAETVEETAEVVEEAAVEAEEAEEIEETEEAAEEIEETAEAVEEAAIEAEETMETVEEKEETEAAIPEEPASEPSAEEILKSMEIPTAGVDPEELWRPVVSPEETETLLGRETDESLGLTREFNFQEELRKAMGGDITLEEAAKLVYEKAEAEADSTREGKTEHTAFFLSPEEEARKTVMEAAGKELPVEEPEEESMNPFPAEPDGVVKESVKAAEEPEETEEPEEPVRKENVPIPVGEIPKEIFADESDEPLPVEAAEDMSDILSAEESEFGRDTNIIEHIMTEPEMVDRVPVLPRKFDETERKIFSYFSNIPGMQEQITLALADIHNNSGDKTSRQGNVLIIGRQASGKTRLAEGLMLAVCKDLHIQAAKKAKIIGEDLNKKDPAKIVKLLAGGFLLIEGAGAMYDETIEKLSKAMEFRTDGLVVILEDEKRDMRAMLNSHPELAEKFTSTIIVPVFTNDELVTFARTYARENGYKFDELATLALYTMIGENQKDSEPMTVGMVKDIVDQAIDHSKNRRFGFRSRNQAAPDGRILLKEKDFS